MTPEEAEFYATPAWAVRRLLEAVDLPPGSWLDPCTGQGAIVDAVEGWRRLHRPFDTYGSLARESSWTAVDIRDTGRADHVTDYLRTDLGRFDVCIMNPPFSKAMDFARKANGHCDNVVMLQRLSWLQQPTTEPWRTQWLREHACSLYVLPERPSFTGKGTDSAGYGWYVWGRQPPVLKFLASTPSAERRADEAAANRGTNPGPAQLGLLDDA